jgi:hypothetical protein
LQRAQLGEIKNGSECWSLLHRNASLGGLCKYALAPDTGTRLVRAELPLDLDRGLVHMSRRLRETCAGLQAALDGLHGAASITADSSISSTEASDRRVGQLLEEAGWPFVERTPGQPKVLTADLENRNSFSQAVIEELEGQEVRAFTEIGKWESLSAVQEEAVSRFLLSSCASLRMVRAVIAETDNRATACFEIRISSPGADEMAHALAALSVAANMCAKETQCFEDEQVAEAYLKLR